jgi:hypothetical protein
MDPGPISAWIDDRDPRVRFSGNWSIGGVTQDFNKTESSSTRVGDSFIVPFYGMYQVFHCDLSREEMLNQAVNI